MEGYYQVGWQCFTKEQTLQWGYYILIFLLILLVAGCIYGGFRYYKKRTDHSSSEELNQPFINQLAS
jgi:hypothetical protein